MRNSRFNLSLPTGLSVLGILSLFSLSPLFGACKKHGDKGAPPIGNSGTIIGTWELRHVWGQTPNGTDYPAGNGNIVNYSGDRYTIFKAGEVIRTGQFTIVADSTGEDNGCIVVQNGQYTTRMAYQDSVAVSGARKIFFQVQGNKLTFQAGCPLYDGWSSQVYIRIATPLN